MSGRIFARGDDGVLDPLDETPYELEEVLQRLLAEHPEVLAVDDSPDGSSSWLLVTREAGVPDRTAGGERWAVDHLFLDRDGIPTLVETKRSSDTRLRREVIGQLLDYAANAVVYWPVDTIRERFETRCETEGTDPEQVLATFLGGVSDAEGFWERVRTNLQAERIRMIVVADIIPRETQRIIEFLNGQLDPAEVFGVEIRQYVGQGSRTLVPQVVGRTAEAEQRKASSRSTRAWDAASFDDHLADRTEQAAVDAARRIRSWAGDRPIRIDWGRGAVHGSFMPRAVTGTAVHPMFSISTSGDIQIHLGVMHEPPFNDLTQRQELVDRLRAIPGVHLEVADLQNSWPTFPLRQLLDGEGVEHFLEVWDWFLSKLEQP